MFKELVDMYLGYFSAHGEPALIVLCNCDVPSQILLAEYKKLIPIEVMEQKQKRELKQYVIEMFPEKTVQEKLNCAKIIYAIGTLL